MSDSIHKSPPIYNVQRIQSSKQATLQQSKSNITKYILHCTPGHSLQDRHINLTYRTITIICKDKSFVTALKIFQWVRNVGVATSYGTLGPEPNRATVMPGEMKIYHTSISANADEPRDAALCCAKSTISCTLSIIIRQWASVDSKLLNRPTNIGY